MDGDAPGLSDPRLVHAQYATDAALAVRIDTHRRSGVVVGRGAFASVTRPARSKPAVAPARPRPPSLA